MICPWLREQADNLAFLAIGKIDKPDEGCACPMGALEKGFREATCPWLVGFGGLRSRRGTYRTRRMASRRHIFGSVGTFS